MPPLIRYATCYFKHDVSRHPLFHETPALFTHGDRKTTSSNYPQRCFCHVLICMNMILISCAMNFPHQLAGSLPALSTAPVDAIGAGNVPIRSGSSVAMLSVLRRELSFGLVPLSHMTEPLSGPSLRSGIQLSSSAPMVLKLKRGVEDAEAAKRAALEAAQRAARNNADAANHRGNYIDLWQRLLYMLLGEGCLLRNSYALHHRLFPLHVPSLMMSCRIHGHSVHSILDRSE